MGRNEARHVENRCIIEKVFLCNDFARVFLSRLSSLSINFAWVQGLLLACLRVPMYHCPAGQLFLENRK